MGSAHMLADRSVMASENDLGGDGGGKPTQGIRTQVLVTVGAPVLGAVSGRIAWYVLGLLVVLLLAAPGKHLVKEAELGRNGAREREEDEGDDAHCDW